MRPVSVSAVFDAQLDHIDYLRQIRLLMGNLPIAVEFRNASWYQPAILNH